LDKARIYEIEGTWESDPQAITEGKGTLTNGNYSLVISKLSNNTSDTNSKVIAWHGDHYEYNSTKNFTDLGVEDGDYIKLHVIYDKLNKKYYAKLDSIITKVIKPIADEDIIVEEEN
jgi:hypothetical protein